MSSCPTHDHELYFLSSSRRWRVDSCRIPIAPVLTFVQALRCIVLDEPILEVLGPFAHVVEGENDDQGARLLSICLLISFFQARVRALKADPQRTTHQVSTVIHASHLIAQKLDLWEHIQDEISGFEHLEKHTCQQFDCFESSAHIYESHSSAREWNHYRVARITLCLASLEVHTYFHHEESEIDTAFCKQQRAELTRMLNEICASIPYHLGNRYVDIVFEDMIFPGVNAKAEKTELYFKASPTLLMPICVCLTIEGLPPAQRTWLETQFVRVQTLLGFLQIQSPDRAGQMLRDISLHYYARSMLNR